MKVVAQQTEVNYPNVLLQFFFYVYYNLPAYRAVFMMTDVLNAMVASGRQPISHWRSRPAAAEFRTHYARPPRQELPAAVCDGGRDRQGAADIPRGQDADGLFADHRLRFPVSSSGNSNNARPMPIIDVIMGATQTRPAAPSTASSIVIEYLSSAGVVVLGEQGVLPVVTQNGGSLQNVAPNIF